MSGGVDSSTAAALLLEKGYDVVGVTLGLWGNPSQAAADAQCVCQKLGIEHHLIDETKTFRREVVQYFAREYKAGRTPNPCCVCNKKLKFGVLPDHARRLGAQYVATGHFARVEKGGNGRFLLKRGLDLRKDQSYFLFLLTQDQLAMAMFPLGEKNKQETRLLAQQFELKTADKADSMEICFVPDYDYGKFLSTEGLVEKKRGEIVSLEGKVLGHHEGISFYTVGQRKGLRVSHPTPLYVLSLDAVNNRVIVGDDADLKRDSLTVGECNWIAFEKWEAPLEVLTRIRYNHPGVAATITPLSENRAGVKLHVPQRAITPGQACVFYKDDLVIGGGWIE